MSKIKKEKLLFPSNLFQFIGLTILSILICIPLYLLKFHLNTILYDSIVFLGMAICMISLTFLINWKKGLNLSLNFKIADKKLLWFLIGIVSIFQIGIHIPLNSFIFKYFHPNYIPSNSLNVLVLNFGAIVLAPFIEELIFRGILLKGLLQKMTTKYAILTSTIIFSLIHINPYQLIGAFLLGILFAFVYYRTKSLGYSIVLHSIANLSGIIGNYIYYKTNIYLENNISFLIFSLATAPFILIFLLKKLKKYSIQKGSDQKNNTSLYTTSL